MKNSLIRPITLCLLFANQAFSDEIKLKDGTRLTGKILSKTTSTYTIEVNITPTIKDQKTIPANQVVFASIESPEGKAFDTLKPLLESQDFDTPEQYQARLNKIQEFLTNFPKSKNTKTVQAAQTKLKNELATISAGGVKMAGKLCSADEYQTNRYSIDSQKILLQMKRDTQNRAWVYALNQFDQLKTNFLTSEAFNQALPLAKQILTSYNRELDAPNLDTRKKKQAADLEALNPNDRANTIAVLQQRTQTIKAQMEQMKSDKLRWFPIDATDKSLVDQTTNQIQNELRTLSTIQLPPVAEGDKVWTDAWNIVTTSTSRNEHNKALELARKNKFSDTYIKLLTAASQTTAPKNP